MKKKKRNLILMSILLVVLIGIFIALQFVGKDNDEDGDSVYAGEKLTSLKQTEISKISYQYKDGEKLNYKVANDVWSNADDAEFPLSSSAFSNNFVSAFLAVSTSRIVTDDTAKEADYGLDEPYLTIEIESKSGKKETFYLGSYNTMLQEYYLKIEGKDKIYTVGTDLVYICRQDMYDYATVEAFPEYSVETLNNIVITNDDTSIELAYFENGYETDLIGSCKWFFGAPFSYYRSAETNKINDMKTNIIDSLQFLKLVNYKPTKEELQDYGLTDVKRKYTINYRETDESGIVSNCSKIVEFGAYDADNDAYYARIVKAQGNAREISSNIYLISKSSAEALLGLDPLDYMYKQVVYIKLIEIAEKAATDDEPARKAGSLVIESADTSYTIENKTTFKEDGTKDQNIYYVNGKLVEEAALEDFYFDILSKCGAERIIYDKSTVITDKEPTYTFTYNRDMDDYYGNVTVQYTQYDANYYQATVNGSTDVLVNKRILDETVAQLGEMLK